MNAITPQPTTQFLTEPELINLIIGKLPPHDAATARLVCSVWNKAFSLKLLLEKKEPKVYSQLQDLTEFIKETSLHYLDGHDYGNKSIKTVLVVRAVDGGNESYPFIAPFYNLYQCKNALKKWGDSLFLSTWSQGMDINNEDLRELRRNGYVIQSGSSRTEKSSVLSVEKLKAIFNIE